MHAPFDIILSGPITGTKDYRARFAVAYVHAREWFRNKYGREANVWNPAMLPEGRTNEWYMKLCHKAIFDSPRCVLVQMDNWQDSKGSRSEHALCVSLGREIAKVP